MINKANELPVSRHAKLFKISRGAVYYLVKPFSPADLALMRHIDELHLEHPLVGARMLRYQLGLLGLHVGRRHVRTLMRRMGIEALAPQPGTSKAQPGNNIYPNPFRHLPIIRAKQVWALDTTNIAMAKGFGCLTAVVDVASRKVLTHKLVITLEACHAVKILQEAFSKFGEPEIVNTDQGSQFTATEFTTAVLDQGCKLSMVGKSAWRDNVFVERVWRSVKYERVYLKAYDTASAARADIADYFGWQVNPTLHQELHALVVLELLAYRRQILFLYELAAALALARIAHLVVRAVLYWRRGFAAASGLAAYVVLRRQTPRAHVANG